MTTAAILETFPDEAAWLAARRRFGIGASEAWDVLFGDRWRVYNEKTAIVLPEREVNDDLEWGHDIEHAAERFYKRRWLAPGEAYERCDLTIVHVPGIPVFATPDAIVSALDGRILRLVEVKRRRWRDTTEWGDVGTDEVPPRVLCQVQIQARLLGIDEVHVFGSLGDTAPRIYVVPHDPVTSARLEARLTAFWTDHVLPRVPPALDGSASADAALSARHPFNRIKDQLDPCPPGSATYRHVAALKAAQDELATQQTAYDTARQHLQDTIGARAGLAGPGFRITWKAGANGRTFRATFTPAFNGETR